MRINLRRIAKDNRGIYCDSGLNNMLKTFGANPKITKRRLRKAINMYGTAKVRTFLRHGGLMRVTDAAYDKARSLWRDADRNLPPSKRHKWIAKKYAKYLWKVLK